MTRKSAKNTLQRGGFDGDPPARLYHQLDLFRTMMAKLEGGVEAISQMAEAIDGAESVEWAAEHLGNQLCGLQDNFAKIREMIDQLVPGVKVEADRCSDFMDQALGKHYLATN